MAVTREEKNISINLGTLIQNKKAQIGIVKNRVRAKKEADFLRKVQDEGLSYEEQKTFYKNLLKEEYEKSGVRDDEYISEIRNAISSYSKIIRAERFYNAYRISFEELKTSKKNIDEHIEFLERQLASSVDIDLSISEGGLGIRDAISAAKQAKFTIQSSILTNKVNLALKDTRRSSVINITNQINDARNKALVSGDDELVSSYDIQLQSLNSQLQMISINDSVHDFELKMMDKPFTSTEFLDELSSQFENADESGIPVNLNGVLYNDVKDYWSRQLNNYIENNFFKFLDIENEDKINSANKKLTPTMERNLKEINDNINNLKNNPYLENYQDKIENSRLTAITSGVEKFGDKVVRDYNEGLMGDTSDKNASNAISKLNQLNKKYGVDVSTPLETIRVDAASALYNISEQQVGLYKGKILEGFSHEEALDYAVKQVAPISMSTGEVLKKTPEEITREIVEYPKKKEAGEVSKYDITETKIQDTQPKLSAPVEKKVEPVEKIEEPVEKIEEPEIPEGYEKISGVKYNTRELQQANYEDIQIRGEEGKPGNFLIGKKINKVI